MSQPIKIMIVDDSLVIRKVLEKILGDKSKFEIVALAFDGQNAVEKLDDKDFANSLDIVILGIEMSRMDGLQAIPIIKSKAPKCKIIISSTLTKRNAEVSLKAMELGAADYLTKPSTAEGQVALDGFSRNLISKIKVLGATAQRAKGIITTSFIQNTAKNLDEPPAQLAAMPLIKPEAIIIGSSTGGPDALLKFFDVLDSSKVNLPIFITQHMPPHFTAMLAENLNKKSNFKIIEAKDGDIVKKNTAYIAPGDFHMNVKKNFNGEVIIKTNQDPEENFCRPAIDPLLRSASAVYGENLIICILTGMGQDGLAGAKIAKESGAVIISQDKETSVVWGMPAAISREGISSYIAPVEKLAKKIMEICS